MTFNECERKITLKRNSLISYTTGAIESLKVWTIELADRENRNNVSCIPSGNYVIRKHKSPKFGEVLKVFDADGKSEVKGRSEILIHTGNSIADTQGCILPCTKITHKDGSAWGENSRVAFSTLMRFVGDDNVGLTII